MSWLEIGLFGSVIFAAYHFQQIKITLKSKGHDVNIFTGWIADYRKFKELILSETDKELKIKYQGNLNGFRLALAGSAVIATLIVFGKT